MKQVIKQLSIVQAAIPRQQKLFRSPTTLVAFQGHV